MIHCVILLASSQMLRTKLLCPALLPQSVSDNRVSAVFQCWQIWPLKFTSI